MRFGYPTDSRKADNFRDIYSTGEQSDWYWSSSEQGDALVVSKLDRLARSVADFMRIIQVLERKGAGFEGS